MADTTTPLGSNKGSADKGRRPPTLVRPNRFERIDLHRASSRNEAGDERHDQQACHNTRESQRIPAPDPEQPGLNQPRGKERSGDSNRYAGESKRSAFSENEPQHVGGARPERHPYSDLLLTLRHGIGN